MTVVKGQRMPSNGQQSERSRQNRAQAKMGMYPESDQWEDGFMGANWLIGPGLDGRNPGRLAAERFSVLK
jgi:hypothetical protein